ncbi:hypothetical protein [Ensifer sp. MJa1]|uniref:hypothetical protein n=1 Tax=Ensifer sp. MJa1 TaxID=2919888 RepID=UPI003009C3E0
MKFSKSKKKHPGKMHKVSGAIDRIDDGISYLGRRYPGFSYRGIWTNEGCPGTFEAWLANRGVMPKLHP